MTTLIMIKEQLNNLGLDQRDLARGAGVTESYISQLLNGRRSLPTPARTGIYKKMDKILDLPPGSLSRMVTLQRQEETLRRIGDEVLPLYPQLRKLVLRKCVPGRRAVVLAVFEKQPFGEIERLVTQILLDVVKRLVTEHQVDDHWLRVTLKAHGASSKGLHAKAREFLQTDIPNLSAPTGTVFMESLIASWDIDLSDFEIHMTLNANDEDRPSRRFRFAERPLADRTTPEPGFIEFMGEHALSGTATEQKIAFLGGLRFTTGRPTPLYYYRELQSVRDPLHVVHANARPPSSSTEGPSSR